jgi:hypothetical protein
VNEIVEGRLLAAQQELTEEMKRLQEKNYRRPREDATVGGIPVDSEYIVFIIDTSGSIQNYPWPLMLKKMEEILDVYPKVKGIQVMSDEGQYMFSQYGRKWIPDTPARRKLILARLRQWAPFSNSSPVEGIEAAIRAFAAPDKKVSLYVLGDEFTGIPSKRSSKRWTGSTRRTRRETAGCESTGLGFPRCSPRTVGREHGRPLRDSDAHPLRAERRRVRGYEQREPLARAEVSLEEPFKMPSELGTECSPALAVSFNKARVTHALADSKTTFDKLARWATTALLSRYNSIGVLYGSTYVRGTIRSS